MMRWIVRLLLIVLLGLLVGLLLSSPTQTRKVEQAFNDQLLKIAPSAAIQAGFVQTMHEQRWGSHAFVHLLGLTLPRGFTEARVRAPIRVFYGVRPSAIHVLGFEDGTLRLAVDRVEVLNVETDLERLEIETHVGWARLDAISGEEARRAARKAFDRTKYRAADGLLKTADVSRHIRAALARIATKIPGVERVEIERRDLTKQTLETS